MIVAVISIEWVICVTVYPLEVQKDFGTVYRRFRLGILQNINLGDLSPYFISHSQTALDGSTVGTIPHIVFIMFQCMFAVITPALIIGAFAERIKFKGF